MNTHVFSGHAQLPEGTNLFGLHKYTTVVMKINMDNGTIMDCIMPIYCRLHNDFIAEIVRGRCIDHDLPAIIEEIDRRVHSLSTRATVTAMQVIYNRYVLVKKKREGK